MESPSTSKKRKAVFGLGNAISTGDATITGSELPTYRQVLRSLMVHCQTVDKLTNKNTYKWNAAKIVLSRVAEIYAKAGIPMISEIKPCQKIIAFMKENAKLREIPTTRRQSNSAEGKLAEMKKSYIKAFLSDR